MPDTHTEAPFTLEAPSNDLKIAPVDPATMCTLLTIKAPDGRTLLKIDHDGTVTGDIEDASEAARVFVETVRNLLGGAR